MKKDDFSVTKNDSGRRIDRIIRKMFPRLPLHNIYRLIRKGYITLNGQKTRQGAIAVEGDLLNIICSLSHEYQYKKEKYKPHRDERITSKRALRSMIIFENNHILVVNKSPGIVVHGKNSLEECVRVYCIPESLSSLSFTPGPAHRLDRNTSGLVAFSKSLEGAKALTEAFKKRHILKVYMGLFEGTINRKEYWKNTLTRNRREKVTVEGTDRSAKKAITEIIPVATEDNKTLAVCIPVTGKTHQIRAQAALHGHPLFCDRKYGSRERTGLYILHAAGLAFSPGNPLFGSTTFFAPLPQKSKTRIEHFFGKAPATSAIKAATKMVEKLCLSGNIEGFQL